MSVSSNVPPLSQIIRINEIGAGVTRRLEPDSDERKKIARALDLADLARFDAEMSVTPARIGWVLTGRIRADAAQTCGITLERLPVTVDEIFSIDLVEGAEPVNDHEVEISLDDDAADHIEDGKIDLGVYALEQLALALDPFPRKPGAEFVQPKEPVEISPFAALNALKPRDAEGKG